MAFANRLFAELRGDRTIWMTTIMLSLVSFLAVASASGSLAWKMEGGNTTGIILKHLAMLSFGLVIVYVFHLMHYMRFKVLSKFMLYLAVPLLAVTLLFGTNLNDAHRWITIFGVSFQTSDFAKIALIMYVSNQLTVKQDYIKDFNQAFVPIIVPVLVICGLIAPANLSTAALLFMTCIALMFIGRVATKYIFLLLFLGIVGFALLIAIGKFFPGYVRYDTWISRLTEFLGDTDGGYQVQQAKIAIARGGWFGVGPGNSICRNFLPYAYADFIFAIICEEWGLIGGAVVLFIYMLLFFRTVSLVTKSPKAFGALVAIGLSLSMVLTALANMAVAVHLVPVTGLTLPMISMGGTSLLFSSIALGIILSVSKYIEDVTEIPTE
jgi:cell division protein FtsW